MKSQNSRSQGFSYYFCLMMEGSGSVQITTDPDPGAPKTYGPQHCSKQVTLYQFYVSPEGVLTSPDSATALAQSPWRAPPYRSLEKYLNKKNGK